MNDKKWGLFDEGLRLPRAAGLIQQIREEYEALTGLTIDWEHDVALSTLTAIVGEILGRLAEIQHAIFDSRDPDVATGHSLDVLCSLVGISRHLAEPSTVELELSGDEGVVVPVGKQVQDDNRNRWTTLEDATIGEGGTVLVRAVANETGPINADAGTITKIHTPVAGWLSVTNPAAATQGRDRETDSQLRLRRSRSLQIRGGSSRAAIRGRLLALSFVRSAEVFHNDTGVTKMVAGVEAPPHSVVAYVASDRNSSGTLESAEDKEAVARVLFRSVAAGVVTAGNDDDLTVRTSDGVETSVQWSYPNPVDVVVAVNIVGVDAQEVEADLSFRIETYIESLLVGQDVNHLQILSIVAQTPGVQSANVTLNGHESSVTLEEFEFPRAEITITD